MSSEDRKCCQSLIEDGFQKVEVTYNTVREGNLNALYTGSIIHNFIEVVRSQMAVEKECDVSPSYKIINLKYVIGPLESDYFVNLYKP